MRTVLSKFVIALLVASGVTLVTSAPAQASCASGTGTSVDPHIITTESELRNIRDDCYPAGSTDKHFKLGNNIRLTQPWDQVIFSSSHGFFLDGDDFEISGLEIQASGSAGMFRSGSGGTIKNLSIKGGEIINTGGGETAVLISLSSGQFTIDNVHIVMDRISGGDKIGGFVADLLGDPDTIKNSSIRVLQGIQASSGTSYIGGVATFLEGTIENVHVVSNIDAASSTNSSLRVGGILSVSANDYDESTYVYDSSFQGSIEGNELSSSVIGGIVGEVIAPSYSYSGGGPGLDLNVRILRSSVRGDLSSAKTLGGILGIANGGNHLTNIEDNKFSGTLDSGSLSSVTMAGAVGLFEGMNSASNSPTIRRNLVQASFNGTATTEVASIFMEDTSLWGDKLDSTHLDDNVYDSDLLTAGNYDTSKIITRQTGSENYHNGPVSNPPTDSDIVGKTSLELTDSSNYPWSSDIKSASTTPDFGTDPRVDVWGICSYADADATAAAAAAGFETTAFLLSEVRRCGSLDPITMDVYPTQTVVAGSAVTPVFPNATSVSDSEAMLTSYYSVSPELPAGLSIHNRTGKLTGNPATVTGSTFTLTATNGVSSQSTTFTLMLDQTPPVIATTVPANSATSVDPSANIVVNFDENVIAGTGKIKVLRSSDSSLVTEANISDPQVGLSGKQLTFNPTANLPEGISLTLVIDNGAVEDSSNNSFAGLASGTISFTTSDITAPTLASSTPANNGSVQPGLTEISLVFSEPITLGTATSGQLALYLTSDDTLVENFDISDSNVVAVSSSTVTIAVSETLVDGESYYLTAPATAFEDASSNAFAGLAQNALTFSVASTPSAGPPYTGPLITSVGTPSGQGAFAATSSATVKVYGERLSGVNKVFIEGKEAVISSTSNDSFVITLPEGLTDGVHDLVIQSSLGNLTYLDGISIAGETVEVFSYGEVSAWTSRISDTQLKVYVKFPTVGEKVRISHQVGGNGDYNTVYVKTTSSETMEGLRIVEGVGTYVVRTIALEEINRIRVTVGDEELVQVRYNN